MDFSRMVQMNWVVRIALIGHQTVVGIGSAGVHFY